MNYRKLCFISTVALVLLWTAGCSAPPVLPQPLSPLPTATPASPTLPAPVSPLSPLPAPPIATLGSGPAATVTAPKDAGAVTGQLLRLDGSALKEILIYAAPIDKSQNFAVASVDAEKDPRAYTDTAGNLAFRSLAPGEYVLVARTPTNLIVLQRSDDKVIRFEIKANQVIALGTNKVNYQYPNGNP